jgi:hypothetical protein
MKKRRQGRVMKAAGIPASSQQDPLLPGSWLLAAGCWLGWLLVLVLVRALGILGLGTWLRFKATVSY